jgi:hypothetical protein
VIVAEADKVTIYDGDDPSLPMWMVRVGGLQTDFYRNTGSSFPITGVTAKNGKVVVCGIAIGLFETDFIADEHYQRFNSGSRFLGSISSGGPWVNSNLNVIVNATINDVAMTVLPDAPIDPATGLPVPTIACLVAETEVAMADGSTKRLDQVVVGDVVKTLEGEHSVLNWWDQGIKDVVELEFDGGQKITCTSDHKIRTTEGWVEAGDLTDAHEVVGL